MESLENISKRLNEISASLNYINDLGTTIDKLKKEILPIDRRKQHIDRLISTQRNYSVPNKAYISQLCDEQLMLDKKKSKLDSVISQYGEVKENIMEFLIMNSLDQEYYQKHSEAEFQLIAETAHLHLPTSVSKSRAIIINYFETATDDKIVDFINSKIRLRGLKRLYIKEGLICSYYFSDLRDIISYRCKKKEFHLLKEIIVSIFDEQQRKLTPLDVLGAIIKFYNKRKSE